MTLPDSQAKSSRRISNVVKLSLSLVWIILIIVTFYTQSVSGLLNQKDSSSKHDDYYEDLYLRPLQDGKLFAHFKFTTVYRKDIKSLRWENKIEIFPLSIAELVATADLQELHFSLTKGNWNYKNWGYPARSSPPGAQIRAKFSQQVEHADKSWQRLINSLAGKFCASLVSADKKALAQTKLSLDRQSLQSTNSSTNEHILYSNLPDETLCTENLTPWRKLLPCYFNSGLASLLNAVNLFKSSHSSLSIDLRPKRCLDKYGNPIIDCEQVHATQSLSVVFNPLLQFEGKQTWSLAKTFGSSIQGQCQLASHSRVHVDITELDDKRKLYPQTYKEYSLRLGLSPTDRRSYATYDLQSIMQDGNKALNLGVKQNQIFKRSAFSSRPSIPVHLRTHIASLGTADGTIVATVANTLDEPIRITYMDAVPHFLRVYLHTLTIRTTSGQELKPDKLNFVLSEGETQTLIEFSLVLPAQSETQISYDFERAFLRWTEFKPDANKGVLLGSTMIGIPLSPALKHLVMPLCETYGQIDGEFSTQKGGNSSSTAERENVRLVELDEEMLRIYSRPLLVILPTPDFSMPYNVLCLVSTVLVTAFGPLHNMATRKPEIKVAGKKVKKKKMEEVEEE